MQPGLLPMVAMVAVVFLPGWLGFRIVCPRGGVLTGLALAPALSAGIVFLAGTVAGRLGVGFAPSLWVLTGGILAIGAIWRQRRATPELQAPGGQGVPRAVLAMLVGGMALSVASIVAGIQGPAVVPPNRDAANHGLMAARVTELESLDVQEVLYSDAPEEGQQAAFYPLALHGQVAIAHRLFGVGIAEALLAATVVFAGLVLPLTIFSFARHLMPDEPRLAGFASLMLPAIGFYPLIPLSWGSMTVIAGLAMTPAVVVLLDRYLTTTGYAPLALIILALHGILGTHSSEVALVAVASLAIMTPTLIRRDSGLAQVLKRGVLFVAAFAVSLLPLIGSLKAGAGERAGIDYPLMDRGEALGALQEMVTAPGGARLALFVLSLGGVAVGVIHRRPAPLILLGVLLGLYLVSATTSGVWSALSLPWYQNWERTALNLVLLLPVLAGLALVGVPRHRAAMAVGLAVFVAILGAAQHASQMQREVDQYAFVDADAVAAFEFLASHSGSGERVLIDRTALWEDGATWMYAFSGVEPLFALQPSKPSKSWQEREWLVEHLTQLGKDPRVNELLGRYQVRYAYVDSRDYDDRTWLTPVLDASALRRAPGVCPRFTQGSSTVFELQPGGKCA